MNTRVLVTLSLLLGIGTVLHLIIPPFFMQVKPDMMLAMVFLGIVLFPEKKNVLLLGIVGGILAALTTGLPGGQIPNIIDKIISAFVFFGLYMLIVKRIPHIAGVTILAAIGTIVSGLIFLSVLGAFFELPGPFLGIVSGIVLPTALLNAIVMFILYPIVKTILQRSNLIETAQS